MTLKLRSGCGVAGDAQGGGENRNDPQISQRMWRRRGAGCARVEDGERFFLIEIKIVFDPCVRRLQKGQIGNDFLIQRKIFLIRKDFFDPKSPDFGKILFDPKESFFFIRYPAREAHIVGQPDGFPLETLGEISNGR